MKVFDLDGTLLFGNSSFRFFFYLIRTGRLPRRSVFSAIRFWCLFKTRLISLRELHSKVFQVFLKGKPQSLFLDAVEPFLDRFLHSMLDQRVLAFAKEGRSFLLSSSPSFLVGSIARRIGVSEWKGSEYSVDKDKNFCDISCLIDGSKKLCVIQELRVCPEEVAAYSDSDDDLPLLEWAGKPFAIKPNRRLRAAAGKRGWPIFD